jgi:hypothetical protein
MNTMIEVQEQSDTLNANDRCDACGSQAFIWVEGTAGDLLF